MKASEKCIALIKHYEQLRLRMYNCPAGHCTIGYGHLIHMGPIDGRESEKVFADGITESRANELLDADVRDKAECHIESAVKVPLTQGQYDALVSIIFNTGPGAKGVRDGILCLRYGQPSTLLRKLNAGDYQGASEEFPKWNKSNGQVLAGLTARRAAEQALFNS